MQDPRPNGCSGLHVDVGRQNPNNAKSLRFLGVYALWIGEIEPRLHDFVNGAPDFIELVNVLHGAVTVSASASFAVIARTSDPLRIGGCSSLPLRDESTDHIVVVVDLVVS